MIQQTFLIVVTISACTFGLPNPRIIGTEHSYKDFGFITREGWNARNATSSTPLSTPVELVIIHHTYIPRACFNTEDCSRAMRGMQDFHQLSNGWVDIGYNFAVGSDGQAYEGRGWDKLGAHTFGFNTRSIGIALIGDWVSVVPPQIQLETVKKLITVGVELGYISPEYRLIGHRQAGATECPGEALFQEISTWERFSPVA